MKIIFDREQFGRFGIPNEPNNTSEKIIARREEKLKKLGEFCNADSIEYIDQDKGELYIITKGKQILRLDICANPFDGGWMNLSVKENS